MTGMPVRVEPDAGATGHALIRVRGATGAATSPAFRLRRGEDFDEAVLGPGGWQARDEWLMPTRANVDGNDLVLQVDPSVCSHLEKGIYTFELPAAGVNQVVTWPDIPSVHAGAVDVLTARDRPSAPGVSLREPGPRVGPTPAPPVPDADRRALEERFRPVAPPPLPPAPVRAGSAAGTLTAFLVALLLLAAALVYWSNHRTGVVAPTPTVPSSPVPAPAPVPGPVQPAPGPSTPPAPRPVATPPTPPVQPPVRPPAPTRPSVPAAPPPLAGLPWQEVVVRAPNPAAIAAEGLRRLYGGQADDGLLLLEEASDRGDGDAAARLARLYDPLKFQPGGPIPTPDARQAARHYRDAAAHGIDVTADREALRRSLESRARGGDIGATLALRDFWP